ncbi:MAG: tRNA preQ1(34) S-adenosylmethionine ribosyltransferase-isomerase QueA [Gemmatimonadetes bacterium]|nr:tRNA preQ1(34) S-adenosylmethionine ribosyltransferase-isomerase QueA [Gemmatimonadota bacterium]
MSGSSADPARGARVSDYEYPLPAEQVARYPTERRDESRLLVMQRSAPAPLRHLIFRQLVELVRPGDVLVVNESRVLPARLLGKKPTGAPSEILLLRPTPDADPSDPRTWEALVRPGGKLKPGRCVVIADDLTVEIVESATQRTRIVRLVSPLPALAAIERHGHVPLPPYLERADEPLDRERYQTVYARVPGSVAAPTAGLHFTPELLDALEQCGVKRAAVALDVGVGTFRPVEGDDPAAHELHGEAWRVEPSAAAAINAARASGGRCWAVGTTVVRTLESAVDAEGLVRAGQGVTRLFIRPPYRFRAVDALITNFHLPRSTLLMLVAAFAGYEPVMDAYRVAVAEGYRFYSYGDALAVVP